MHPGTSFSLKDVQNAAYQVLNAEPDPVTKFRLINEVLRLPGNSQEFQKAHFALAQSKWVQQLQNTQLPDGSWGRFHSQDTKVKTVFRTTEEAIDRAFSLGLTPDHPALARAKAYIENVLAGRTHITDWEEKNDAWPILIQIILAGKLAEIDASNPAFERWWEYMAEVARQSFSSGSFCEANEIQAYLHLSGIHVKRSFLQSRYAIAVLSARSLSHKLEHALVEWLWHKPDGMSYLQVPLSKPKPEKMPYWLKSMNILHHFPSWRDVSLNTLEQFWKARDKRGWWDFETPLAMCRDFPISEDWRQPLKRKIDYSTCMLVVLRRYFD